MGRRRVVGGARSASWRQPHSGGAAGGAGGQHSGRRPQERPPAPLALKAPLTLEPVLRLRQLIGVLLRRLLDRIVLVAGVVATHDGVVCQGWRVDGGRGGWNVG